MAYVIAFEPWSGRYILADDGLVLIANPQFFDHDLALFKGRVWADFNN